MSGPHRGHQPQLLLVSSLGFQQLPSGTGAFPLPAGTLLLHRAPSSEAEALHARLTGQHFRPQPARDSNPNRSGGRAAERSAPPGAESCAQDGVCAAASQTAPDLRYGIAPKPGWCCRCMAPAGLGPGGADRWPSFGWHKVGAAT